MPRSAGDLAFAAFLALLSYAPFEYVAKTTLVVAATLFVLDPLPPYSRMIALISIALVGLLNRIQQTWQQGQGHDNGGIAKHGDDERHRPAANEESKKTL
jgi:hypothetical protein